MISFWRRSHTYLFVFLASCLATTAVIANAFIQRKQFYPAVVYITKSNASMAAIYFQGLTLVWVAWKIVRWIFFGQLRPAEIEHLMEKSWFALTETCLAFTVFRDDFSSHFVALFTILLFLKCFHWLAEDRVDFMERTPVISKLFHIRVIGLLVNLAFLDSFFAAYAYHSLVTKGVSVQLVFGFEYAILCTVVVFIGIKYVLHCIDLANDQTPWDRKSAVLLYSELVISGCKVALYGMFLVLMLRVNNIPLFAIRPIYLAFKSFKKALYDVIMSRKAIHMMNTLYPDATLEEIRSGDTTCIICREEMVSGCKRLPCNHIFHTHCLRSWFQRQQTCPTCRLDILRPVRVALGGAQAGPAPAAPAAQANAPWANPGGPQMVPPPPQFGAPGAPFPFMFPGGPAAPGPVPMFPMPPQMPPLNANAMRPPGMPPFPGMPPMFPPPPGMPGIPTPPIPPPWFFMPMPVPPMPVPNFAELSDEELAGLEGNHRRALELRVMHLRNIQALLDAAVIQFSQYISLIPSTTPTGSQASSSGTTSTSNLSSQPGSSTNVPSEPTSSTSVNEDTPSSSTDLPDGDGGPQLPAAGSAESDEVRRRRLDRFA